MPHGPGVQVGAGVAAPVGVAVALGRVVGGGVAPPGGVAVRVGVRVAVRVAGGGVGCGGVVGTAVGVGTLPAGIHIIVSNQTLSALSPVVLSSATLVLVDRLKRPRWPHSPCGASGLCRLPASVSAFWLIVTATGPLAVA